MKAFQERYQELIDLLINSRFYDHIYFDPPRKTPKDFRVYEGIATRNRIALQEMPGKGSHLQKGWKRADITPVKDEICDLIIEEEFQPNIKRINEYIPKITKCRYLWIANRLCTLCEPWLFIVLPNNADRIDSEVLKDTGTFRKIVVCNSNEFKIHYEEYCLKRE
jgi:hypothetical protein